MFKEKILQRVSLVPIDYDKPFELYTDASEVGIGACLVQDGKPVAFFSRKFNSVQQRYSVTKREAYAMAMSVLHFKYYLIGQTFTVYTDHKALEAWYTMRDETYAKWMAKLEGMTFEVKYIEGVQNVLADLMSRPYEVKRTPLIEVENQMKANAIWSYYMARPNVPTYQLYTLKSEPQSKFLDDIKVAQSSDLLIKYKIKEDHVRTINDIYYYVIDPDYPKLIVPPQYVPEILKESHNFGHLGHKKLRKLLQKHYYWPRLSADCFEYCKQCTECQKGKRFIAPRRRLQNFAPTTRFRTVHTDIVELPASSTGKRYILTIMDRFSRWLEAVPLKTITAEKCARAFYERWICYYGVPDYVITDQGSQFESALFNHMLGILDIKRRRTTAYHPQANGLIERSHATIKQMLRCVQQRFRDWEAALPTVMFALRNAVNEQGISPSLLLFGESVSIPGVLTEPVVKFNDIPNIEFVDRLVRYLAEVKDFVFQTDPTHVPRTEVMIPKYPHRYIWIREPLFKGSLYPKVRGPYRVIDSEGSVLIIHAEGRQQRINMDRARPAYGPATQMLEMQLPEELTLSRKDLPLEAEDLREERFPPNIGTPLFGTQINVNDTLQIQKVVNPFEVMLEDISKEALGASK